MLWASQEVQYATFEKHFNPMSSNVLIDKYERRAHIDITKYRGIIGFLLCLTTSRTTIMFSVCMYARFQACPKESHFKIVK